MSSQKWNKRDFQSKIGIYIEMTEDLSGDEIIVFGGMIDLGSKIKKTKEYAGVGVKYCFIAQNILVMHCTKDRSSSYQDSPGSFEPL